MKPQLESQPDLLAAWLSARRPFESGGGASVAVEPDIAPVKAA